MNNPVSAATAPACVGAGFAALLTARPSQVSYDGDLQKARTVSASALARHLDCSRAYIEKLEAEGVLQQHGDGFPLDQSRIAYL